VWDGNDGTPVPAARVTVLSGTADRVLGTVFSDLDGRFDLELEGSGEVLLIADKSGFVASAPYPLAPAADTDVEILLEVRGLSTAERGFAMVEKAGNNLDPPSVLGWVTDRDTGRPVQEAEVQVLDSPLRTTTDVNGMFVLNDLTPGQVALVVSHLSFSTAGYAFHAQRGRSYEVRAQMRPEAIGIEGIEVTARSRNWFRKMDGLRFRMSRGLGGDFVLAEQFEQRGYPSVVQTLRDMPGVDISKADPFNYDVRFRNCELPPVLYIDGIQVNKPERQEPLSDLTTLSTVDVQAVEVYRGAGSLPAEFAGPDAMCGAIVVWTKRGG
jgi:Carboxypeptidase regulatory-like domain/TonB-dependent Receptor Plug Domain